MNAGNFEFVFSCFPGFLIYSSDNGRKIRTTKLQQLTGSPLDRSLGSACASRAGDGALAITNFFS
jgi:hypothetical protein